MITPQAELQMSLAKGSLYILFRCFNSREIGDFWLICTNFSFHTLFKSTPGPLLRAHYSCQVLPLGWGDISMCIVPSVESASSHWGHCMTAVWFLGKLYGKIGVKTIEFAPQRASPYDMRHYHVGVITCDIATGSIAPTLLTSWPTLGRGCKMRGSPAPTWGPGTLVT